MEKVTKSVSKSLILIIVLILTLAAQLFGSHIPISVNLDNNGTFDTFEAQSEPLDSLNLDVTSSLHRQFISLTLPFPFASSGTCTQGTVYTITNVADLTHHTNDLECIFHAGLTPSQVPVGSFHLTLLSVMNTEIFNSLVALFMRGKMVVQVPCTNNKTEYLGWNNILGPISIVPFVARIGGVEDVLAPGEFDDGRDSLIMDFTRGVSKLCGQELLTDLYFSRGIYQFGNLYPANQAVDALRLVGRRADGSSIYLGKTFWKTSFAARPSTIAYIALVNYGPQVNSNFTSGHSLPPLGSTFQYRIPPLEVASFGQAKTR